MIRLHDELSVYEQDELSSKSDHDFALQRYLFYRRRGLPKPKAYRAAIAWGRNVKEQALRRKSHGTGAT